MEEPTTGAVTVVTSPSGRMLLDMMALRTVCSGHQSYRSNSIEYARDKEGWVAQKRFGDGDNEYEDDDAGPTWMGRSLGRSISAKKQPSPYSSIECGLVGGPIRSRAIGEEIGIADEAGAPDRRNLRCSVRVGSAPTSSKRGKRAWGTGIGPSQRPLVRPRKAVWTIPLHCRQHPRIQSNASQSPPRIRHAPRSFWGGAAQVSFKRSSVPRPPSLAASIVPSVPAFPTLQNVSPRPHKTSFSPVFRYSSRAPCRAPRPGPWRHPAVASRRLRALSPTPPLVMRRKRRPVSRVESGS
jgi:hypothetical protein